MCTHPPRVDNYFAQKLLLWLPRRLWRVKLYCPQPLCINRELTSAGLYPHIRQVVDIDSRYNLATEYLECSHCRRKVISWSDDILKQLSVPQQTQFPVILTYKKACDVKVIRLLRQRGLGNSASQLQKKIHEQHSESWLMKTAHYLSDCKIFVDASNQGLISMPNLEEPVPFVALPQSRWFQTVYCKEVLQHLPEVKAAITSVFGNVLKMDSTKKIVKKLAGTGARTASWATNVGNEFGQVLISVMTASEGHAGLKPMVTGLVERYRSSGMTPPQLLYVDRDCCGSQSHLRTLFGGWPSLMIRLDVWHFMRRIATGCTTDAHQLYGVFMGRLSNCIFEWSASDVERLKVAKRGQLQGQHVSGLSDDDIIKRITRKELARHCRRRTRTVANIEKSIHELLVAFLGNQGKDTLGVPLLKADMMRKIWDTQKKHLACLQDPEGLQLYAQTGTIMKGGFQLPVYRCARGSTSLESFHLHLNRFIPGSTANDLNFQAYLLEGLVRWNEDRALAATDTPAGVRSYDGLLRQSVNELGQTVFGKNFGGSYTVPQKYTGELIGMEYLYRQTGEVLEDIAEQPNTDEDDTGEDDIGDDDDDEGFYADSFDDLTVPSPDSVAPHHTSPLQVRQQLALDSDVASTSAEPDIKAMPHGQKSSVPLAAVDMPAMDTTFQEIPLPSAPTSPPVESPESTCPPESHNPDESVGPDSIPGYGRVDQLAQTLFTLKDQSGPVTYVQAMEIVRLWRSLEVYDKKPTVFSPRFKAKITTGRFKVSKTTVQPGVESTKRCFLGESSGPAQWPDCNRYVESLMSKLCECFPSSTRSEGKHTPRWTHITRAYKNIRQKVLDSAIIMSETSLQLVDVNNTTLMQWYNKKMKKQEKAVLMQGITHKPAPHTAPDPLPEPVTGPRLMPQPKSNQPHVFVMPANTAGQANTRGYVAQPMMFQVLGQPAVSQPLQAEPSTRPASTLWYQKRKAEKEAAGQFSRKYVKKTDKIICSKCQQPREKETHKQYYGSWYCATTSDKTYDEWKEGLPSYQKKNRAQNPPTSDD
ncbi:uncharacterized protein LOC119741264 [Patiria miniata]|uniref:SBP-type domain-containing protein n=1 Tax=Patiria miniata TaxID=46514 RepID=A0A914B9T0_PATMI|nr:uncharacterized protein LOC119741264 [Patiria miniata]